MDEPLTNENATKQIKAIVASGGVAISPHALDEMADDGLTVADVVNVLRAGFVEFSEEKSRDDWRYRCRTNRLVVVVKFLSETRLRVVTVWRMK